MTFLVPIMLFGWVPLSIIFFSTLKPHRAALVCILGGMLFLPMAGYNFSGFPEYDKATAIALGLILGGRLSGQRQEISLKLRIYDLPMILWCLCPIASSVSNHLGYYDGLSSALDHAIIWGIPYFCGRIYFQDAESLRDACLALVIGGLIYAPLCLFEVRMSPQLSNMFYGFFPHSWLQHFRAGYFRPIVFMQHGLMVSLWMAVTSVAAFWLWRSEQLREIKNIPMGVVFILLSITCLLTRSVNSVFALIVGCSLYYFSCLFSKKYLPVFLLLLTIPLYISFRLNDVVEIDDMTNLVADYISPERLQSFETRLTQEELFSQRVTERPWFGFAGYGRGKPIDPKTGEPFFIMIDAFWLISFRSNGFVGLVSVFSAMLIGPLLVLRSFSRHENVQLTGINFSLLLLSVIVILFMIDSLLNGMLNTVYILISGMLVSTYASSQPDNMEVTDHSDTY